MGCFRDSEGQVWVSPWEGDYEPLAAVLFVYMWGCKQAHNFLRSCQNKP